MMRAGNDGEMLPQVRAALDAGADVDGSDSEGGDIPIELAIGCGWCATAKLLLDRGARFPTRPPETWIFNDANATDSPWPTPIALMLYDRGTLGDVDSWSPLMRVQMLKHAAFYAREQLLRAILRAGVDVNMRPTQKRDFAPTVLMTARCATCTGLLLAAAANVLFKTEDGESALTCAAARGDVAVLRVLLRALWRIRRATKRSIKQSSRLSPPHDLAEERLTAVLDLLGESRAFCASLSPVHVAADDGHDFHRDEKGALRCARLLLHHARRVDVEDDGARLAAGLLQVALAGVSAERATLQLLLDEGVDVDRETNGCHPLVAACRHANVPLVDTLLEHDADPNVCDECHLSRWGARAAKLELLPLHALLDRPHGAEVDEHALRSGLLSLLHAGADLARVDQDGRTALHAATESAVPSVCVLETLLGNDAAVNALDRNGRTPLHCLLLSHSKRPLSTLVLRTLLDARADLNIVDHSGLSALHCAMLVECSLDMPLHVLRGMYHSMERPALLHVVNSRNCMVMRHAVQSRAPARVRLVHELALLGADIPPELWKATVHVPTLRAMLRTPAPVSLPMLSSVFASVYRSAQQGGSCASDGLKRKFAAMLTD